jgi:hypothetical protein
LQHTAEETETRQKFHIIQFLVSNYLTAYHSPGKMSVKYQTLEVVTNQRNLVCVLLNLHLIAWAAECRPLRKKARISYLRLALGGRGGSIL